MVGRADAAKRAKPVSKSKRAGLVFPVGRVHSIIRKGNFAKRIGTDAAIRLAAVLQYLVAEILELAGNACIENNKSRLSPRHIMLAIHDDADLNLMLKGAIVTGSGVIPNIPIEIAKRTSKKKNKAETFSQEY